MGICKRLFIKNNNKSTREPTEIIDEFILYCREEKLFEPSIIELFNEFSGALKMNGSVKNFDDLKLALSPNNPDFKRFYFRSDSDVVCEYPDNESYVTLTTIHSAKGLEWENVIIPGMSKDSFPRYFKFPVDEEAEMPNEIKKFYVACTRSKRRLFFTRANYNQYGYKKDISSFVNNIDEVKIDV